MGGRAFASHSPPLATPRIPTSIYKQLRDYYIVELQELYEEVAVPIEAPGKLDHGDIDILACGPKSDFDNDPDLRASKRMYADVETEAFDGDPQPPQPVNSTSQTAIPNSSSAGLGIAPHVPKLLAHLRPAAHILTHLSPTITLALPHPNSPDAYIQLDVTIIPAATFEWNLFLNSHGDLWNLISPSLRRLGLVANPAGLCLTSQAIEPIDKKAGRMVLTSDEREVREFLGLNAAGFDIGFASEDELFEAVVQMRFFKPDAYVREGLRSNDRRRLDKRDGYKRFVEAVVPRVIEERAGFASGGQGFAYTRDAVREEVLERWNKRGEWEEMHWRWAAARHDLMMRQKAKEMGKEGRRQEAEYASAWLSFLRAAGGVDKGTKLWGKE